MGDPTVPSATEKERDVELLVGRAELQEELERLFDDLRDSSVGPIDLVHDHDDRQARRESLAEHEPRLGPWAFRRIDEQHRPVDHRERPLHLTAEVGMTGCVDDVQSPLAEFERRLLGENRDALFSLEVHRVEDPVDRLLAIRQRPGSA